MKYTITQFRKEFPNDEACLQFIYNQKFPEAEGYYRVKGRKCWSHKTTKHQIHPLVGTIFEKSSTPLTVWFEAIYLFSVSKNGVSAKELQRHFGFTYKTAWRVGHQIRALMVQGSDPFHGEVEADETFYGKKGINATKFKNKKAIIGIVERKGRVRTMIAPNRRAEVVLPFIKRNVMRGSRMITDEYRGYDKLSFSAYGYRHFNVKHGKGHYSWKGEDTNTIEGFWGQFKRSVRGTYAFVSSQHLQAYLNEFSFRYNLRDSPFPIFSHLMWQACV
jgi:transposase-like protein